MKMENRKCAGPLVLLSDWFILYCTSETTFSAPMDDPILDVVGGDSNEVPRIRLTSRKGIKSFYELFLEINWKEPWLLCLIGFHATCFLLTVVTTKYYKTQVFLFLLFLGLVFSAEYINEVAANNWQTFSEEQYFDSKGLFISAIFSGPLLINSFAIVLIWLYKNFQLLVKVKRAKLRQDARNAKEQTEPKKEK